MKRTLALLALMIGMSLTAFGQFTQSYGPVGAVSPNTCSTTAGTTQISTIYPCGGVAPMYQNSGINLHQVSWKATAGTGAVSTCTFELETSSDGVTWVIMSGTAVQTCTTSGSFGYGSGTAAYVRGNVLSLTTTQNANVAFNYYGTSSPPAPAILTFSYAPTGSAGGTWPAPCLRVCWAGSGLTCGWSSSSGTPLSDHP